jgi:hypothetical protein
VGSVVCCSCQSFQLIGCQGPGVLLCSGCQCPGVKWVSRSGDSVRGFCFARSVKVRGFLVVLPLLGLGDVGSPGTDSAVGGFCSGVLLCSGCQGPWGFGGVTIARIGRLSILQKRLGLHGLRFPRLRCGCRRRRRHRRHRRHRRLLSALLRRQRRQRRRRLLPALRHRHGRQSARRQSALA